MPKTVISDTSTLILFHKIGEFELLRQVYGELITTPEIAKEFGEVLPQWIKIQPASDKKYQKCGSITWCSLCVLRVHCG